MSIVPDALLQRRLSFARRLVVEPLGVVAFGITGIALGLGGAGVWAVVAASYAAMIVRTVLVWAFAHWRPRPRTASFAMWRELTGYARHVVLGELVRRAASQLDVLLVGRFVGIAALGQYRYATRLAQLPLSTWVSVGAYVLLPVFARLAKEPPRLRAATLNVVRWMATAVMPVSLLLFALGLPAAIVVFGEEWKQAGYGVMALSLMPIGLAVVSVASEVFKAIGRPQELPKLHTFHGVASAAAMLALLPFGMFGVAAGASVASLAVGTFAIIRLQKAAQIPARAVLGMLLVPLLAAAWMGGLGYAIDHLFVHAAAHGTVVGLLLLVAETIVLLAVYAATLLLVSRPHRRMFAGIATKARRFVAQRTHRPAPARS